MSLDKFAKLRILVGKIRSVKTIEGKDKLYVLNVKADREREIVAGLKPFYEKEELEGKKVLVLINIKPKKIGNVTSEGMVLAAVSDDGVAVLEPLGDVEIGSQVL